MSAASIVFVFFRLIDIDFYNLNLFNHSSNYYVLFVLIQKVPKKSRLLKIS